VTQSLLENYRSRVTRSGADKKQQTQSTMAELSTGPGFGWYNAGMSPSHIRPDRLARWLAGWWSIVRGSGLKWWADNALRLGASLSFYTAFALSPLLIIVIAVAGLVLGEAHVQQALMEQIRNLVGPASTEAIQSMLASARPFTHGALGTAVSIATVLVLATGVLVEMQDGLNMIWKSPIQDGSGLWRFFKDRVLSFLVIVRMGFLLLVSLVIDTLLGALGAYLTHLLSTFEAIMYGLNLMISIIVVTVLFALMFRLLPRAKVAWDEVWIGAGVTAVLFTVGKFLIGVYLGKAGLTSAYGAASSLMVILLWVYYSSLIFYFGAEFTYVYAVKSRSSKISPGLAQRRTSTEIW
jgi:membrane protein